MSNVGMVGRFGRFRAVLVAVGALFLVTRSANADDAPPPLPPLPPLPTEADMDAEDAISDIDDDLALENIADPGERARARAAREHARQRRREARQRHPHRPPPQIAPPRPPRPPAPPRVLVIPQFKHHHFHHHPSPVTRTRIFVLRAGVEETKSQEHEPEAPPPPPHAEEDLDRAHGGLALTAGGTRYFGVLPSENVMMGARLQLAAPLPTEPTTSRWLSSATVGLAGGIDVGTSRGVDGQLWHAGLALSMGAPWTRDFIGVGLEGGIIGGHYWDGNNIAYSQRNRQVVVGPHGEGVDPKPYGLARLTLQVPLRGNIRPFVSGDFGVTERSDEKLAGILGVNAGLVWNAW